MTTLNIRLFVKPNRSAMESWLEHKFGAKRRDDFRLFVLANGDTRVFFKRSSERANRLMRFDSDYATRLPMAFDSVLHAFCKEFGFLIVAEDKRMDGAWFCVKQ